MGARVLLIAESANPEWASVPLIGWSLSRALAQVADAHVVTQVRNRQAFLTAGVHEGTDFTAIDTEQLERPLWKLAGMLRGGAGVGWTTQTAISSLSYPYFERQVWKRFGPAIQRGQYDLVHRITPLSPTAPSPLARRCAEAGVPFVLGPLNGGVPWPAAFAKARRQEREWLSYVRGAYRWLPGAHSTVHYASAVIAGSRFTLGELPQKYKHKYHYLPENAIDPERFNRVAAPYRGGSLNVSFVGRLVPYKGPDMLLEAALSFLRAGRMKLAIVGDGPLMPELKRLAHREGVASAVTFHGWIEHDKVQDVLSDSHVMALPSIREFGGGVVLEAMALGVVPLVVDYAGPGELVDAATGMKVTLGDRSHIVAGVRHALSEAMRDPEKLGAMATAARDHVQCNFTWRAKAVRLAGIYESLLSPARPTSPRPT